jgi:hypothetical protein
MQLFTVEQANRTLPLVRRIVEDLVREHAARAERLVEAELLSVSASPSAEAIAAVDRAVERHSRELDGFERELRGLGIQLKDPHMGLIDFPANLDGRRVLLCWHLGEPSVQFWHDEQSGFAGRQPLSPSLVG